MERTRTPGSSVTNSEPNLSVTEPRAVLLSSYFTPHDRFAVFQGCSLWLPAVLQHLTCPATGRAAGGADLFLSSPAQCFS